MSEYAYGTDEEHVTIRLRSARGDLTRCILHFGDRACRQTPVIFTAQEMQICASDEYFDYYEAILSNPYKRLNYYFELCSETEHILYYGDCFMDECVDDRSEYYQLPYNHRADIVSVPDWAKDAVIYNIFPDSFATGRAYLSCCPSQKEFDGEPVHGKLGGTIKGIAENVSYLKELGINAVYINPIFAAGEYHKYDLLDYFHIDPCFGTNEEFREMVKLFHANGIRVIIDGALQSVDQSYYESALLDGANWTQRTRYITLPAIRPIIAPSVIITIFTTFKQFDVIYLLTQQAGAKTGAHIHTILTYAYENAFITNNYGYSSAVSMIIFVILIVFSYGINRKPKEET